MSKFIVSALAVLLLTVFACRVTKSPAGTSVQFPKVSEPIQITKNGKEHMFASYYGITSWNPSQRYATVLQTGIKHKLPDENEPATLGLVDMNTYDFIPLTTTRAWNFQEGCMAHWLDDDRIIYNDIRNGKTVSIIMNVNTKKEIKTIPYPVSGVSPNGKEALSLNFSRLRITRTDYGYGGAGQDAQKDAAFPANDGLYLVDLETGVAKLLVSLQQVQSMVPVPGTPSIQYFAHSRFNTDGSKIFWLSRGFPEWNTSAFTINKDGSNLQRCFPDKWGGSHYDWLNVNELMITANYNGGLYGHILFTVGQQDYKRLGNGILDYDGHGTFSPDKKWMVTDTYPDKISNEQKIYLMDMKTQAVLPLGRFTEPPEYTQGGGHWRCDIHCRWSPKGNMIGFNSTKTGSRQVYMYKVAY